MAGGLAEWLRHFNDLAVGEAAAPACFSRENAKGGRNVIAAKSMKPISNFRNSYILRITT